MQGWDLPEAFALLRRLMEARMGKHGRREYVQVLRLLESFTLADLHGAVKQALDMGAIGFDAVKHVVPGGAPAPQTGHGHLSLPATGKVEKTSARSYLRLLSDNAKDAA